MKIPRFSFMGSARELMYLSSCISIRDNSTALVENCRQIMECTDICVRLMTGSFEIEVWGSSLSISSYLENSVEINGRIEQVKLVSRRLRECED